MQPEHCWYMQTGTQKGDEPIPRWAADPEIKPTPAEEVAAGLRRGRSHRDAPLQPGFALPPAHRANAN